MEYNQSNYSFYSKQGIVTPLVCDEEESRNLLLIQSILFDVLGGSISSACLYKFYQGIEISHPLYAVLFSNLTFSTSITFLTFVPVLLWTIDVIPCHIALDIIDYFHLVFMMNIITWCAVVFLRNYLLKKEDSDLIDLSRLRNIALTSKWIVFVFITSIRTTFIVLIDLGYQIFPINVVVMLCFLLFFIISFFVVSYRTDCIMKEKLQIENSRKQGTHEKTDEKTYSLGTCSPTLGNEKLTSYDPTLKFSREHWLRCIYPKTV